MCNEKVHFNVVEVSMLVDRHAQRTCVVTKFKRPRDQKLELIRQALEAHDWRHVHGTLCTWVDESRALISLTHNIAYNTGISFSP